MLCIFFVIEKIRKLVDVRGNLRIFDVSLFFVIIYLIVGFILNIIEFYIRGSFLFMYSEIWFFPIDWLEMFIIFSSNIDINFRINLAIMSILLFFIVYYALRLYYKWKEKNTSSKKLNTKYH